MVSSRYNVVLHNGETVALSDGTRFYKQIVRFGKWANPNNPGAKMSLDKAWAQQIVANFKNKVAGRVPVPLSHTDLPEFNTGEVQGLEIRDDGLYATLDIRDPKTAQAIDNDLIWDVSVSFDNNYVDKKSGKDVGPTLLHVALVNNPYLKGMAPFKALADRMSAVMLSEEVNQETNSMAVVTNDRDFDVTVTYELDDETKEVIVGPGEEVEVPEEAADTVTKQIADAEAPAAGEAGEEGENAEGEESEGGEADGEVAEGDDGDSDDEDSEEELSEDEDDATKLARENAELRRQLAERDADKTYSTLLSEGKIVPAQKEAFMALSTATTDTTISLADGSTKSLTSLIAELFEAAPKRISFSEEGVGEGEKAETAYDKLSDEERANLDRLGVSADDYNKYGADGTPAKAEATTNDEED